MSREAISVTVDRTGAGELTASTRSLALEGPLEVHLESVDAPTHVHCRLEGALADLGSIENLTNPDQSADTNYYVAPDAPTVVLVDLDPVTLSEPLEGELLFSAAYGSLETSVQVRLEPEPGGARVDRTLGTPSRHEPEPSAADRAFEWIGSTTGLEAGTVGVIALAALAIVLAWSTAAVVGGTAAYLALLVVVVGVLAGAAVLTGAFDRFTAR